MCNLEFCDPKVIGKALLYVAGHQALAEESGKRPRRAS
jgi:hypothetical protein